MNNLADKNLELSLLNCCMIDEMVANKAAVELTDQHFKFYPIEFNVIKRLVTENAAVDLNTVYSYLPYQDSEKQRVVKLLMSSEVTTRNHKSYIKRIKDLKFKRDIIAYADNLKASIGQETTDLIGIMSTLPKLDNNINKHKETRDIMQGVAYDIGKRRKQESDLKGLTTTFNEIDKKIQGIKKGETMLVKANSSVGKSLLCMNIGMRLSSLGYRVDYASYEMVSERIGYRMAPKIFGVDSNNINFPKNNLTVEDVDKIEKCETTTFFENFNIFAEEMTTRTVEELIFASESMTLRKGEKPDLIIVDYLQIMACDKGLDEFQGAAYNFTKLQRYALKTGIPIITIVSESKDGTIRGSNQLKFDADIIISLEREFDSEDPVIRASTKLTIEKCRDGRTAKVDLLMIEKRLSFEEVDKTWMYQD